jgi:hypothetical protein
MMSLKLSLRMAYMNLKTRVEGLWMDKKSRILRLGNHPTL